MAVRKTAGPQIRVSPETHAKLQELAKGEDRTMGEIATDLVDRFEREKF
jgi:predicted transcriptional regulator